MVNPVTDQSKWDRSLIWMMKWPCQFGRSMAFVTSKRKCRVPPTTLVLWAATWGEQPEEVSKQGPCSCSWLFHTHNSVIHSCVPHNSDTHNFTKPNSFAHSFVTHNYLTHNSFTHNSFTHSSDTHNSCTRNIVTHDSIRHSSVTYNSVTDAQLFHIHICHTIGLPPSPISFLPFSSKISDSCLLE